MGKRTENGNRRGVSRSTRRLTSAAEPKQNLYVGDCFIEQPDWNEVSGSLTWGGCSVLVLASHAHCERAVLREFQRFRWAWIIRNPVESATIGDPTQERRHAIYQLNAHQQPRQQIHFFSLHGRFVGWCDAGWIGLRGPMVMPTPVFRNPD